MAGILDGIRIIDLTEGHTGSYGTMLLADFGAEVIKIEDHSTGGDMLRESFPKNSRGSAYHAYLNRGKKSVCIDRNSEKGRMLIGRLICGADVVCEAFPAGELEKCGLDYETMSESNPRIIYASHTGFGKTGPMSGTAGNDLTAEALCGLMQITGFPGHRPSAHGSRIAEQFGGVYLAFAVTAALMARDVCGKGQQIDIASADCMFTALEDSVVEAAMSGKRFEREGNRSRSIAPYDTFEVKDGILSTAVSTDRQWEKFCRAVGLEYLLDDPRFATNDLRGKNYDEHLRELIASKFRDMTKWEIEELLRPENIPSGPGYTVPEAFESEQLRCRNMVVELDDIAAGRISMPGMPAKISGISDMPPGSAPLLGGDTGSCLRRAGLSSGQIGKLEEEGVVMCRKGAAE